MLPREETPIFRPEFPFWSISFSQIIKKSVPGHHHFTFFGGFCCSGDRHFKISLISTRSSPPMHGRLSPNAKRSAAPRVSGRPERQPDASWQFRRLAFSRSKRIKLVPEPRIFTLKTAQARSGAPTFSRSTGSSFRSPGPFFTLPRHIHVPTQIWGEYRPPPPPGLARNGNAINNHHTS